MRLRPKVFSRNLCTKNMLQQKLDEAQNDFTEILANATTTNVECSRLKTQCHYALACIALARDADKTTASNHLKAGIAGATEQNVKMRMQSVLDQIANNNDNFVLRKSNTPVFSMLPQTLITTQRAISPVKHSTLIKTPVALSKEWMKKVVAITGSGISVESGLRTRQDLWSDPLWNRDACVSIAGFHENPNALWQLVKSFLSDAPNYRPTPNRNHFALARLEEAGILKGIITQNVDELHQQAGSKNVIELHGSLNRVICTTSSCTAQRAPIRDCASIISKQPNGEGVQITCECGGILRPDVVLFGEVVPETKKNAALDMLSDCELLLVIGTASDVAPASDLIRLANTKKTRILEIGLSPTMISDRYTDWRFESDGQACGDFLVNLVEKSIANKQ